MITLSLCVIWLSSLPHCQSFLVSGSRNQHFKLAASTTNPGRPASDQEEPPNLYQILGASPKDSDQELKRKWQQLAKKLHPDANVISRQQRAQAVDEAMFNGSASLSQIVHLEESYPYDLSDVNAAWVVLSDPKERRKYDRALQAQEFADTFEILLDAGIKTAIPFLRKTANTTIAAAQQSTKVINDVNKRMAVAAAIFDLESEARELDQKASKAKRRIQTLQDQLVSEINQQTPSLQSPDAQISAAEAIRLLNRFNVNMIVGINSNKQKLKEQREVEILQGMELEYKATQQDCREAAKALQAAQRKVSAAIQAEQLAQERLLRAQQDLADAQAFYYETQQLQFQTVQEEQNVADKEQEQAWQLRQQSERVKYALLKAEERSKQQLAVQIERDIQSLQESADEFERTSLRIKQQANKMKQQQAQEE